MDGLSLETFQPHILGALTLLVTVTSSAHAVLYKRDPKSAAGWVAIIWLVPLIGAASYLLLGINRIKRRASELRAELVALQPPNLEPLHAVRPDDLPLPEEHGLRSLVRLVDEVVQQPLLRGNSVLPLENGEQAYPAMLEAIAKAQRTVTLSTYIFDNDRAGKMFCEGLSAAVKRGVDVRVIIDDVGARYTIPTVVRSLQRGGVRVSRFVPTLVPWLMRHANLRNHRKILVVDGTVGFTGGMNIRGGHLVQTEEKHPVRDLHFRLDGPVVAHLQRTFAEDWEFCTGERILGEAWFPTLQPSGPVAARGIADGPDEDIDKLRWALLGALACAESSVRIVTPYFLPDPALVTALNVCALRGVKVQVVLPETNNLPFVKWASAAMLWQVLEGGCEVHFVRGVFDHTKLVVVDGMWTLLGSANWDPRSLRLNFEFNVECYDAALAAQMDALVDERLTRARRVFKRELDERPLPYRLRDGVARLFAPYL